MYHIPAEILAKSNDAWYQAALGLGVSPEKIVHLNWGGRLWRTSFFLLRWATSWVA